MMHGSGKSDRPIVPEKSPNKAGRPAAEEMEGRGLAEGNSQERKARRTQGRAKALKTLKRVRRAAKRDKRQRFTSLLHHIYFNPRRQTLENVKCLPDKSDLR